MMGDFNEIISPAETRGGNFIISRVETMLRTNDGSLRHARFTNNWGEVYLA